MERILTPLSVMMYWLLLTVMGFYDHTVKQLLQCIMDTNVNIIIIIIITIILILYSHSHGYSILTCSKALGVIM